MKISKEDYEEMKNDILDLLKTNQFYIKNSKKSGHSNKRIRWDLLTATKINWNKLYKYLNDDHIDTALKKITDKLIGD